jgi:glutamyl/glutaminyl-tRNA synthetase
MPYRLRTRIAPTPSGVLHVGNAWSFTLTWLAARATGGHVHLRIDDMDAARSRPEHVEDIFAVLEWLGLDWDSGPRDAAEFRASHSQRLRLDRYRAALETLRSRGCVYACTCSRTQVRQAGAGNTVVYPGTCRDRGTDAPAGEHALRFRLETEVARVRDPEGAAFFLHPERDLGDFILLRKNGDPAYQLTSLVDDEELGINFIVRGLDLMPSTGVQVALAETLGLRTFPQARFWHHSLILDDQGEKLSKSVGSESLRPAI